jgi:hypothetical protein
MQTTRDLQETRALVAEYKACVERCAALAILNSDGALLGKLGNVNEAARLNCETVRAKLDESRRLDSLSPAAWNVLQRLRAGDASQRPADWRNGGHLSSTAASPVRRLL